MGFIDYKGTKEDRYSEVLDYARAQQEEDWKQKQNSMIKNWLKELNADFGLADLYIQEILKLVIIEYRELLGYKVKLFSECNSVSMSQLWNDYLTDLIMRHIQPFHLNIDQRKAYYDSFYIKIFKLGNEKISDELFDDMSNNHEYRRYMIECFDPAWKDQQIYRLLYSFCKKDKYKTEDLCRFISVYRKLGLYINLYLYQAAQPRDNGWILQEQDEWHALIEIEEKIRRKKYPSPDINKLNNPLSKNKNDIEVGNVSVDDDGSFRKQENYSESIPQSKLKKKEFYELIDNGDIKSYVNACLLILECDLPDDIKASYEQLVSRMPVLLDATIKFDDVYHADMSMFEEYYAPEALKITAVYLDYQAIEPSESVLSETREGVSLATQKLLQVVNEKIDEIYKFVTMETNAEAKALEAMMNQDGYIDNRFKLD